MDNSAYRFRVDNHYLFVSRKNATGRKEEDEKSRRLYVTSDYGGQEVQFNEVQLPSLEDEQVNKLNITIVYFYNLVSPVLCCDGHT